jgi:hypothetical protein
MSLSDATWVFVPHAAVVTAAAIVTTQTSIFRTAIYFPLESPNGSRKAHISLLPVMHGLPVLG